jgi:hypothetical protein
MVHRKMWNRTMPELKKHVRKEYRLSSYELEGEEQNLRAELFVFCFLCTQFIKGMHSVMLCPVTHLFYESTTWISVKFGIDWGGGICSKSCYIILNFD